MAVVIDGTTGIATPGEAVSGNISYTGTLTGGTGVVNLGSGQVYKDASGNVGVGTASPYTKLQVTGTIKVATGNAQGILSLGDGGGASVNCGVWRGAANAPTTDGNYLNFGGYDGLVFATGNAAIGSQTERARIDTSGNLLVGTTNATLYNQGAGVTGLKLSGTNTQMAATGTMLDLNNTSGAGINAINFWYRGSGVGNILTNTTSTAYNTSSDYRLKEAVTPMTGALEKVAALKPVIYKWKVDGSDGEGFIAHELQAVCPLAVNGDKDAVDAEGNPQYQGIDTSFLVATLTAAIQEQQTLIVSLQDTLTALTARITALEAPIV